ncbi:MAG: glycerate kinase [Halobacteriales archaeon]
MIENRSEITRTEAHDLALDCLAGGIEAAHPSTVTRKSIDYDGETLTIAGMAYDLSEFERITVLGGGKAAAQVTSALEGILGDEIESGHVVTSNPVTTETVTVGQGGHPIPTEAGVEETERIRELATAADERTLVLAVITGGGSALMALPADGIDLADLQSVTDALLESGATIHDINAVRKHLSAIKGGRLARAAAPATVAGVIISDVVGDDLDVIASGPTVPDRSTFEEALSVLERYEIDAPGAVRERLDRGRRDEVTETPKPGDSAFDRVDNHIIANTRTAIDGARRVAAERHYQTLVLTSRLRGEARELAKTQVAIAEECVANGDPVEPPCVVLAGGESTVTISGSGIGGPNQELAVGAAIEGRSTPFVLASVDTDGRDGSTEAAGGIIDGTTVDRIEPAQAALADNDAYPYLNARRSLIRTGDTGTNVNDLLVMVIDPALTEA